MTPVVQSALGWSGSNPWVGILLDSGLKGLVLLVLVWLVLLCLRRSAATTRHLVCSLAVVGLLLLPVLSMLLPAWRLPVLPARLTTPSLPAPPPVEKPRSLLQPTPPPPVEPTASFEVGLTLSGERADSPDLAPSSVVELSTAHPTAPRPAPPNTRAGGDWRRWLPRIWLAGAVVAWVPWLFGLVLLYRLHRRSQPLVAGDWAGPARAACHLLGLRQEITLRQSNRLTMPVTWGWRRPVLLLPAAANQWSASWRRAVLFHELAHVKRRDWLSQSLAEFAAALHWPNPLVWLLVRRMRLERERACDDLVLNAGSRPSDYAEQLLELSHQASQRLWVSTAAIAMARRSSLEGRVLAILDKRRNRRGLSRRLVWGGLVFMLGLVVPMATLKLGAKAQAQARPDQANASPTNVGVAASQDHDRRSSQPPTRASNSPPELAGTTLEKPSEHPFYNVDSPQKEVGAEAQLTAIIAKKFLDAHLVYSSFRLSLSSDTDVTQVPIPYVAAVRRINGVSQNVALHGSFAIHHRPGSSLYQVSGQGELAEFQFMVWIEPLAQTREAEDLGSLSKVGPPERGRVIDISPKPRWLDPLLTKMKLESGQEGSWAAGYKIDTIPIPPAQLRKSPAPVVTDTASLVLKSVPAYIVEGGSLVLTQVPVYVSAQDKPVLFGSVLDPDGRPVAGATPLLCRPRRPATIKQGRLLRQADVTDSRPEKEFLAEAAFVGAVPLGMDATLLLVTNVVVADAHGFAWLPAQELGPLSPITLRPWGRVEGRLLIGRQPAAHKRVRFLLAERAHTVFLCVHFVDVAETDAEGRFAFEHVPPGWIELGYETPVNLRTRWLTSRTVVKIEPGQTTQVTLGGRGRTVEGRIIAGNAVIESIDFDWGDARVMGTYFFGLSLPFAYTDACVQDPRYHRFAFRIQADGTFRINDVPPGKYVLAVQTKASRTPFEWMVEVSAAAGEDSPFELGQLRMDVQNLIYPPIQQTAHQTH